MASLAKLAFDFGAGKAKTAIDAYQAGGEVYDFFVKEWSPLVGSDTSYGHAKATGAFLDTVAGVAAGAAGEVTAGVLGVGVLGASVMASPPGALAIGVSGLVAQGAYEKLFSEKIVQFGVKKHLEATQSVEGMIDHARDQVALFTEKYNSKKLSPEELAEESKNLVALTSGYAQFSPKLAQYAEASVGLDAALTVDRLRSNIQAKEASKVNPTVYSQELNEDLYKICGYVKKYPELKNSINKKNTGFKVAEGKNGPFVELGTLNGETYNYLPSLESGKGGASQTQLPCESEVNLRIFENKKIDEIGYEGKNLMEERLQRWKDSHPAVESPNMRGPGR